MLLAGYVFIRRKNIAAHKACMVTAFALSSLFLLSYLYYHFQHERHNGDRHARIARWTLPLWLYVSVTGVVIYWMLYQIHW